MYQATILTLTMALRTWLVIGSVLPTLWCHATLQLTGTTINMDNVSYWVPPTPVGQLDSDTTAKFFSTATYRIYMPFTVVTHSNWTSPGGLIKHEVSRFLVEDDVWTEQFSSRTFFLSSPFQSH